MNTDVAVSDLFSIKGGPELRGICDCNICISPNSSCNKCDSRNYCHLSSSRSAQLRGKDDITKLVPTCLNCIKDIMFVSREGFCYLYKCHVCRKFCNLNFVDSVSFCDGCYRIVHHECFEDHVASMSSKQSEDEMRCSMELERDIALM